MKTKSLLIQLKEFDSLLRLFPLSDMSYSIELTADKLEVLSKPSLQKLFPK